MVEPTIIRYPLPQVPTPIDPQDIANKAYVDAQILTIGMGDLEFLRDKQIAGDLIDLTASTASVAPATVVSVTPASGKTFFVADSNCIMINDSGALDVITAQLENDGTAIQIFETKLADDIMETVPSVIKGDSMIGDGALIYRIQKTDGAVNTIVVGTLLGWIQDT